MSSIVPHQSGQAVPADDDNRYAALQHKLTTLATALDGGADRFATLLVAMLTNASRTESAAADIAHADLDPLFVEMTNVAAVALGGAAVEVRKVRDSAQQVAGMAQEARTTHARLYEGLDRVRQRRERTPKPGFLVRRGG
ncbi:conjugal transfer protein TraB [Streptomyces sp. NPDC056501]|uniref:conjugal transfer protein TraB n=1 Tax=Streptomyces sp. NPDC056501 TaxID=3345841 RepID=UPI003691983A